MHHLWGAPPLEGRIGRLGDHRGMGALGLGDGEGVGSQGFIVLTFPGASNNGNR